MKFLFVCFGFVGDGCMVAVQLKTYHFYTRLYRCNVKSTNAKLTFNFSKLVYFTYEESFITHVTKKQNKSTKYMYIYFYTWIYENIAPRNWAHFETF